MRKTLLLVVLFCLFALTMLAVAPKRRSDIPHPAPCCPGEKEDRSGTCYSL